MKLRVPDPRPALVLMVAVLATWLVAWRLERAAGLSLDIVVLGTMVCLTLGQSLDRVPVTGGLRHRAMTLAIVPVGAVAAVEVGRLLADHRWVGGAVFCLALGLAVWVRRFGPLWTRLGSLAGIPLIAILVAPPAPGAPFSLRPALVAVVAVCIVAVVRLAGGRTGLLAHREPAPVVPRAPSSRRVAVTTSMAVQLTVGLAVAFALGQWLFPDHWPWAVLSCYVVHSGSRGRGDVVHKGLLRLAGALAGTVVATLVASPFRPGDRTAVVLLFVVMALAVWLRPASYAYWAAGVTAMLALLQGFTGAGGLNTLDERLIGVTLGAVIAVASAWFILPVRSRDAFRRRWADALAALAELLAALGTDPDGAAPERRMLSHTLREVERLEPAYRLHRRTWHRWCSPAGDARPGHPADLVALLRDVVHGLGDVERVPPDVLAAWRRQAGVLRTRIRGEATAPDPARATGEEAVDRVSTALRLLVAATTPRCDAQHEVN